MRAAILREYDTTPELGDFDDPTAGDGQEVGEVLAAGLNPVDLRISSGTFWTGAPPLPSVAAREGIARLDDGRRVYFDGPVAPYGALAERVLLPASSGFDVPEGVDDGLAIALGIAGLAGWMALSWSAKLQPGETVIVLGASGVVGLVGVQAAKLLGAGRVVAVARREEGLKRAAELGADATVALADADDVTGALREACGGGANVVVDPLWGEPAVAAFDVLERFGRHVALGQSAGASATLTSAQIRNFARTIIGHTNYAIPEADRRAAYEQMLAHAAAGELVADYESVGLDDAPAAWERQREGPKTKLIVTP